MKKTIIMTLVALTTAVGAQAQDNVVVNKKDGTSKGYDIGKVSKITFGTSQYTIVGKEGGETATVSYSETKSITFDLSDGIEQTVSTKCGQLSLLKQGNTIKVSGFAGSDGQMAIYKMDGTMVSSDNAWQGSDISIESLPSGIYILNVNGQSLKFTKQ